MEMIWLLGCVVVSLLKRRSMQASRQSFKHTEASSALHSAFRTYFLPRFSDESESFLRYVGCCFLLAPLVFLSLTNTYTWDWTQVILRLGQAFVGMLAVAASLASTD